MEPTKAAGSSNATAPLIHAKGNWYCQKKVLPEDRSPINIDSHKAPPEDRTFSSDRRGDYVPKYKPFSLDGEIVIFNTAMAEEYSLSSSGETCELEIEEYRLLPSSTEAGFTLSLLNRQDSLKLWLTDTQMSRFGLGMDGGARENIPEFLFDEGEEDSVEASFLNHIFPFHALSVVMKHDHGVRLVSVLPIYGLPHSLFFWPQQMYCHLQSFAEGEMLTLR